MATPSIQFERTDVTERVLEVIRELLVELGSEGALASLSGQAHLDRDLGLGSLERVELLARLESAFHVRLPDRAVGEANTPDDLVQELVRANANGGAAAQAFSGVRAAVTTQAMSAAARSSPAGGRGVEAAETLLDVLRYRARFDAERPHLIVQDDEGASVTLTFAQLYEGAQTVAAELARRGVAPGDTVALMLPTSQEFFLSFAGILLAGAIPVPIYPPFRADQIEEYAERQTAILQNAEARLLVTFRRAEAVARLLKPRVKSLAGVVDAAELAESGGEEKQPVAPGALPVNLTGRRAARKADDIAFLQYTSGSTGEPKGVVLTHANLLANIRAISEAVEVNPADVGVSWLPLYHDMGLIGAWLTPLYNGLPLAVMSPMAFLTRPERWLWAFHQHRGTLAAAPNFAYELCVRKIADRDIEGLDLSSWRAALNGAEPVNPETLERFSARFAKYGFRREALLPVYGLAEASLAVTAPRPGRGFLVDRIERETFTSQGRAVPAATEDRSAISFVSSGAPVPRHEVKIADERGNEAEERVEGYLWFRGPSVTRGYYRNPAATETLFPQGQAHTEEPKEFAWVDSGDRAYRAGGEIYITGRVKDIIIKAGRNIYPHEVEDVAGHAEGVRKGCVVAFGLRDGGAGTERLAVVAETRETQPARRAQIAQAIKEEINAALGLPPDVVELIPPGSIPKTSSGKLRREETKRLYLAQRLESKPPVWMQIARLGTASALRAAWQGARRGVRRTWEVAYGVYALIVFGMWIVPAWALVQLMPSRHAACRFTSAALKAYLALVGCRVRVEGREYLERSGPQVLVSNHTSYFDALALMAGLGVNYRFVAKIEVGGMPFIATFLKKMGHYSFDRSDPQARLRQAEEIEQTLQRGESVLVFPEGTFTPYEGVRPFQLGAFKAAVAAGCPICPVSLQGTRQFLRDRTTLPRITRVTITISAPIAPPASSGNAASAQDDSSSDWHAIVRLRDAAREAIARHCGEPLL